MSIVLLSLVGNKTVGFPSDRRRANAAASRVSEMLYIVGDIDFWVGKKEVCLAVAELAALAKENARKLET